MSNVYTDTIVTANSINSQAASLLSQLKSGTASASVVAQCNTLIAAYTSYIAAKNGLPQRSGWVAIQEQMSDVFITTDSNIASIKNFLMVYGY